MPAEYRNGVATCGVFYDGPPSGPGPGAAILEAVPVLPLLLPAAPLATQLGQQDNYHSIVPSSRGAGVHFSLTFPEMF